jgi:hypothetical protein
MEELLSNPRGLVIICCFGALVLGLNMTLVGVLRGDKRFGREAAKWTQAFGGGRATRKQQDSDAAELNRLVRQLKEQEHPGQDPTHDPHNQ